MERLKGKAVRLAGALGAMFMLGAFVGCSDDERSGATDRTTTVSAEERLSERLSGEVHVASAPVSQPFATRAAANFEDETPVEVGVREMEPRAALARLCAGEVAMALVGRPLGAELRRTCQRNDIDLLRVGIGRLAVSIVASSELDLDCMSLAGLRRLWPRRLGRAVPAVRRRPRHGRLPALHANGPRPQRCHPRRLEARRGRREDSLRAGGPRAGARVRQP